MVCKYKFVRYGHAKKKLVLYLPQFKSYGPLKSDMSHLKNLILFNFQDLDSKFVLALKPRVLKLEGSSFGIRPIIYVLKGCFKDPPPMVFIQQRVKTEIKVGIY